MPKTIDQLPGATTLTGTETLPVNQAGVTKHANINMIQAFIATLFEAAGAVASGMAAHLATYTHGDIAHTNRAALDQVSGTNTGDQDISGLALKASPALTGTPTAPTAAQGTKTTQLATTQFVLDNAAMSYTGIFEPGTKYANMIWYNTTDNSIQQRNAANTAWVYKGPIDKAYEAVSALNITYTGVWSFMPLLVLVPPAAFQIPNSPTTTPTGKSIESFVYNEAVNDAISVIVTLGLEDLSRVTGAFSVTSMGAITSLSAPLLSYVGGGFAINSISSLAIINFPALEFVGGQFQIAYITSAMSVLSFPALSMIRSTFYMLNNDYLVSVNLPQVSYIGGLVNLTSMHLLSTLSLPMLQTINGYLSLTSLTQLQTLSLPSLKAMAGNITLSTMTALTTISLPSMVSFDGFSLIGAGCTSITTITIGATLKRVTGNVIISTTSLTQATVDHILARLAALDGTNGTTAYSSKTVTLTGTSATPSAAGLASKAILVGRGCTVSHN